MNILLPASHMSCSISGYDLGIYYLSLEKMVVGEYKLFTDVNEVKIK